MNDSKINHEEIKKWYEIEEKTWTDINDFGNGIWCFKNVIPESMNIVESISSILDKNNFGLQWMPAYVGYQELMPEYRDCQDFKYRYTIEDSNINILKKLNDIYKFLYFRQLQAVKIYARHFNISPLMYWEAMNLVKYVSGQHFQEHHDHGYSYNCTVSLVAYLNDNYEGGELYFRLQDLNIKPNAGDLFVFPSNYMYPHKAMPVISGTKYSLVTMLDYSDKFHK